MLPTRSSALYHLQRIHSMTRGLRVPVAWPHDGNQHDKGSGLPLSQQYNIFAANMLLGHAINHGTKTNAVEPAIEELRELMFDGKFSIAGHNTELFEEIRNYHRDENFKIVKQRDMRRQGKPLSDCDGVGYGIPALC
jgi:hypothetical protein